GGGPGREEQWGDTDNKNEEHAGEDGVGKEMPAEGDAKHAHGHPEGDRRRIGERTPRWRRQGGRRQRPERSRAFARDERAVFWADAARIPPRDELLAAAKLGHVDRP